MVPERGCGASAAAEPPAGLSATPPIRSEANSTPPRRVRQGVRRPGTAKECAIRGSAAVDAGGHGARESARPLVLLEELVRQPLDREVAQEPGPPFAAEARGERRIREQLRDAPRERLDL